jgi:hypothetical protein
MARAGSRTRIWIACRAAGILEWEGQAPRAETGVRFTVLGEPATVALAPPLAKGATHTVTLRIKARGGLPSGLFEVRCQPKTTPVTLHYGSGPFGSLNRLLLRALRFDPLRRYSQDLAGLVPASFKHRFWTCRGLFGREETLEPGRPAARDGAPHVCPAPTSARLAGRVLDR